MSPLDLIISVALVTASGALAPGPVVSATVLEGSRHGTRAGIMFSIAHALVEFPLVLLLALGLVSFNVQAIKVVVGILGGFALLSFVFLQARGAIMPGSPEQRPNRLSQSGLFLTGVAFNALNPFFIIWWLTVGAKLILDALSYGSFAAIPMMYVPHILIDIAWLVILAYSAMKERRLIGSKGYRALLAIFGIAIMLFGMNFLFAALTEHAFL